MNDWSSFFFEECHRFQVRELIKHVEDDYHKYTIYPPHKLVLNSFSLCPYSQVKAVIVGQDPYHNPGQAMGLSFSVPAGQELPPSLVNIFQEYHDDLGLPLPASGDLSAWEKHGVLLLNSVLTVKYGMAFSCAYDEYKVLFNDVIRFLNKKEDKIVFILWGASAQSCSPLIDEKWHHIIASAHPSPLSAYHGFFGSKPFSKANQFLTGVGESPIDWSLK
jgi:uracil-DNA glycosylase